jgi:DNA-binding transcriptional MerR regulator
VTGRRWRVGELAAATGVTVRALHHFDEIGLVRPSQRSAAGHRRYTPADVERLYRVLALRQLGVALGEIGAALDDDSGGDLLATVDRQLAHVQREIGAHRQLRRRLLALAAALRSSRTGAGDLLIETMEDLMRGNHFDPEQLARLKTRHGEGGGRAEVQRWRERWTAMAAEVRAHLTAGASPADPAVRETARRWARLMDEMGEGDPAFAAGMYAKIRDRGPEAATLGAVDTAVWEFVSVAFAVNFGRVP